MDPEEDNNNTMLLARTQWEAQLRDMYPDIEPDRLNRLLDQYVERVMFLSSIVKSQPDEPGKEEAYEEKGQP